MLHAWACTIAQRSIANQNVINQGGHPIALVSIVTTLWESLWGLMAWCRSDRNRQSGQKRKTLLICNHLQKTPTKHEQFPWAQKKVTQLPKLLKFAILCPCSNHADGFICVFDSLLLCWTLLKSTCLFAVALYYGMNARIKRDVWGWKLKREITFSFYQSNLNQVESNKKRDLVRRQKHFTSTLWKWFAKMEFLLGLYLVGIRGGFSWLAQEQQQALAQLNMEQLAFLQQLPVQQQAVLPAMELQCGK